MSTILIDQHGSVWDQGSSELRLRYGAHCSNTVFEKFLVRNLGFISLRQTNNSCVIRVASTGLSFAPFATLSQLLYEMSPQRIAVSIFKKEWRHSLVSDPTQALNLLIETACSKPDRKFERFNARERLIDTIHDLKPLAALLGAWQENPDNLQVDTHSRIFDENLGQRFVVIDKDRDSSRLIFSRIGKGFSMYDKGWAERLIGCPVDHQPDLDYAQWVAASWGSAFEKSQPTLNDIEAVVTNPVQKITTTVKYSRLTLPITNQFGIQQLLSASLVHPCSDLSVKID